MSRFLDDCAAYLRAKSLSVIRVSEIKDGGEPETLEFKPGNPCQNTYSVAKTFAMTGIGLLYDRGLIALDEPVCSVLADEIAPYRDEIDPRWFTSTVEMALTHRLGLPGGFLDIDVNPSALFGRDYLRYMMTHPLDYAPGEGAKYSDGAFYLVSRLVEKRAGMPLDTYLWRELFWPLGYQEMAWSRCPLGHAMGATGLYLHSSDMVKLAALYLDGGLWHGQRLLSEKWVELAVTREFAWNWDAERRMCAKGGMRGQMILFIPGAQRSVAIQSFEGAAAETATFARDYPE